MDALEQQLEKYNRTLEELTLPSALIDCFEHHRRREMRKAAAAFNDNELSWLLDLLNQLRGVADRLQSSRIGGRLFGIWRSMQVPDWKITGPTTTRSGRPQAPVRYSCQTWFRNKRRTSCAGTCPTCKARSRKPTSSVIPMMR